jgi:hypothetical protein
MENDESSPLYIDLPLKTGDFSYKNDILPGGIPPNGPFHVGIMMINRQRMAPEVPGTDKATIDHLRIHTQPVLNGPFMVDLPIKAGDFP